MEDLVRKMIRDLRAQVVEKVPEVGEFKVVYADFENTDKGYCVSHWMLKVTKPPKGIEGHERKRYLELVAYNLPSPYIAENVICHGDKQDILENLTDEDNLIVKILWKMPDLARDLEDI